MSSVWLQKVPTHILSKYYTKEPCPLFVSAAEVFRDFSNSNGESKPPAGSPAIPCEAEAERNNLSSSASGFCQASNNVPKAGGSGGGSARKYSFGYIWGSTNESQKWNKKRIITMRRERFETQKTIFTVYINFWMENMFNLFGLEINTVALLLASFALLNAIPMLYIALLAACILLNRNVIRKLWPALVFLLASILVLQYFVIWKSTPSANTQTSSKAESVFPFEFYDSPASMNAESLHVMNSADHSFEFSHCEIIEAEKDGGGSLYDSDKKERSRGQAEDNSIVSDVQLLGDGS